MKKRLKGLLSLMLALVMMLTFQVPAMADDGAGFDEVCITSTPFYSGYNEHNDDFIGLYGAYAAGDTYTVTNPNAYSSIEWYLWKEQSGRLQTCDNVTSEVVDNTYTITTDEFNKMRTIGYEPDGVTINNYYDPILEIRVTEKEFDVDLYEGSITSTKTTLADCTVSTLESKIDAVLTSGTYNFQVYVDGNYITTYQGSKINNLVLPENYDYDNISLVAVSENADDEEGYYYINSIGVSQTSFGQYAYNYFPGIVIPKNSTPIENQLPTVEKAFYDCSWNVWEIDDCGQFTKTTDMNVKMTGAKFVDTINDYSADATSYLFEAVLTPKNYTIPIYTADGVATGKSVTLNIDDASTVTFPTGIENNGYKLVYSNTDKGTVSNGANVWTKIEAIGNSFDASNAKIVALAKEGETTTAAEKETTTVADKETTTAADKNKNSSSSSNDKNSSSSNDADASKSNPATGRSTAIPFVSVAFLAVVGATVVVVKRKTKEA